MQFKCLDELPGGLPVTRCTRMCSLRPVTASGWIGGSRGRSESSPWPGRFLAISPCG